MSVFYTVRIYDPNGANMAFALDFISVRASIVINDVGALELNIPVKYWNKLQLDGIIEIERAPSNRSPSLLFETRWFIRYFKKGYGSNGTYLIYVIALSAMHLLKRRIVAYAANSAQAAYSAVLADNAMKLIVSQNFGGAATDAARNIAGIMSIQANTSLAPAITKAFAWSDVLPVLQEIAHQSYVAGTYLAFDVVATSGATALSFDFRTYIGQRGADRRIPNGIKPLILDIRVGNLSEAFVEYDYRLEENYIYALGQGQGSQRATTFSSYPNRISASPAGRIEGRRDARNTSDPVSVQGESDAELRAKRGRKNFIGRISETATTVFGVTYNFGDYLTASLDNESFDVMLEAMVVTMDRNGTETIEAIIKSPVS